ncbi:hypothetical protein B0173_03788 [Mycobacterium avium subsp. paratuberculosis]|nr:hypothetical protein B0173_03788 [Mycobacterium avium subsp. paratuberculosis]
MAGIVLGVAMTPTKVRMVLVEGESADGVTVDEDDFDVDTRRTALPGTAPDQVISAILGTREGAADSGYQLLSTGVTWTDHVEAAMLRDALIAHKVENVMLVSAFMAAAALTQAVGDATNYARTAMLFVEPYSATMAVVDTADGSVSEVRRRPLPEDEDQAVAELVDMAASAESLPTRPEGLVLVGSGVDVPLIKPALEAATSLELSVPDEPEMALARGAALASANAPLFASSTAALAYALDPGTGEVDPLALAGQSPGLLPGYQPEYHSRIAAQAADAGEGKANVAYSAVPDDDAEAKTLIDLDERARRRKSLLLVSSTLPVIFIAAVVALEIALAISIRPTVALRPSPNENIIAPRPGAAPARATGPGAAEDHAAAAAGRAAPDRTTAPGPAAHRRPRSRPFAAGVRSAAARAARPPTRARSRPLRRPRPVRWGPRSLRRARSVRRPRSLRRGSRPVRRAWSLRRRPRVRRRARVRWRPRPPVARIPARLRV